MIRSRNVRRTEGEPRQYRAPAGLAGLAGLRKPSFSFRNPFFTDEEKFGVLQADGTRVGGAMGQVKIQYNNWKAQVNTPIQWTDKRGIIHEESYATAREKGLLPSARGAMMSAEYQNLRDTKGGQYQTYASYNKKGNVIHSVSRNLEDVKQRRSDWCNLSKGEFNNPCLAKCAKRLKNKEDECDYIDARKLERQERRQGRGQQGRFGQQPPLPMQMEEEL